MPEYIFKHPMGSATVSVIQRMDEPHVYFDQDGLEWDRVYSSPNTSIDTRSDGSYSSFKNQTSNKKGITLGDMWDASRESSEKRTSIQGKDSVKEKFFKDYSKNRLGKKHLNDK